MEDGTIPLSEFVQCLRSTELHSEDYKAGWLAALDEMLKATCIIKADHTIKGQVAHEVVRDVFDAIFLLRYRNLPTPKPDP